MEWKGEDVALLLGWKVLEYCWQTVSGTIGEEEATVYVWGRAGIGGLAGGLAGGAGGGEGGKVRGQRWFIGWLVGGFIPSAFVLCTQKGFTGPQLEKRSKSQIASF